MKKSIVLSALFLMGVAIFVSSCKKEDEPALPVLSFKTETGYISTDIALPYGDTLLFGITATSNGTDKLVKFQVFGNGVLLMDSTFNTDSFSMGVISTKSILAKEVWKFVITDIAGNFTSDSITVTGDFGEIFNHSGLALGAQISTTVDGFISFSTSPAVTYTLDEAFNHQADIDMFCFYENTASHVNLMTLAAPGSNITGIFTGSTAPENYTTKNVTFFCKTDLTPAMFDAVTNDAVILASFDPDNKFKKAKLLVSGDVYAFKLQSGKFGLLKVTNVTGVEDGSLAFDVKIQK